MDEEIDTNISNYSLSELMEIINISELDPNEIITKTNYYIKKFEKSKPQLSAFFLDIQSQLLQYEQDTEVNNFDKVNYENKIIVEGFNNNNNDAIYPSGEKIIKNWYENEYLTQTDENQTDKITDRKQKIQIYGNEYVPMNREQIATTDTFDIPVKQDSLNPNLKNTINRFINLDSQFRQYTTGTESQSTNYTCDLSDTIKNTLKLSLYSYQIPFSWYAIDKLYGNNCFWISDPDSGYTVNISLPSGNYTQSEFATQLNLSFLQSGFETPARDIYPVLPINTPVYYNSNSGLITIYLYNSIWTNPLDDTETFTVTTNTKYIFYDFTSELQCNINCASKTSHYFNNTLGWIMGYRLPYLPIDISGNTASCILDLNGTKYLILVVDDYNQNHVNNSLISISQFSNTLKIPYYYSPDLPYTCITPLQAGNNLTEIVNGVMNDSLINNQTINTQNGLLIAGKYEGDYTNTQIVLPSAPRTLTNAQLYTINSINSNNNNLTKFLAKAPTSSDILAIIPVKTSVGVPTGTLLVEFSGSLKDSSRTYFGPVNIDRMAIKLLDDKGNILNLNGNDWCFSLVAECLYQY